MSRPSRANRSAKPEPDKGFSMGSEEERERLKEEYKAHYREIKDLKQKLAQAERLNKIRQAMQNIDPTSLMESFDQNVQKVQQSALEAEAKLDMALESHASALDAVDDSERMQKLKADELLKQLRQETETPKQPSHYKKAFPDKNTLDQSHVVKTIGRKKEDS